MQGRPAGACEARQPQGEIRHMAEKQASLHSGHRARLKARFVREGLDAFEDHNALELLLFYAIPQRDTNELAHRLIAEFGSLSGVFDASVEALTHVSGVGENTAVLIHLMSSMFAKYEQDKANANLTELTNAQAAGAYLVSRFVGKTKEQFLAVCMTHKCRVVNTVLISEGTLESTDLNIRGIAEAAIQNRASHIILAHNHPAGVAAPSAADIEATRVIVLALRALHVQVDDHIIVAGKDWFSMKSSRNFRDLF